MVLCLLNLGTIFAFYIQFYIRRGFLQFLVLRLMIYNEGIRFLFFDDLGKRNILCHKSDNSTLLYDENRGILHLKAFYCLRYILPLILEITSLNHYILEISCFLRNKDICVLLYVH